MILIDTDVLIEYLRGSAGAVTWLATLEEATFAITGVVEALVEVLFKIRLELGFDFG